MKTEIKNFINFAIEDLTFCSDKSQLKTAKRGNGKRIQEYEFIN